MNFKHYSPKASQLVPFIDFYYFLEKDYKEIVQFFAFPHLHKPLNIHRSIQYEIGSESTSVIGVNGREPTILTQGVYKEPILINFSGMIDKLTIIFKDGALNNFTVADFGVLGTNHTFVFRAWEQHPGYHSFLEKFFNTEGDEMRIAVLEDFLLSILKVRDDWELYSKASQLLLDTEHPVKVSEVAKKLFISERSLHRLVYKYNGLSPANFRKIGQFRSSLNSHMIAKQFKSLTDLAYKSNYYDASYFTKIYKSLTRRSPKAFFKQVATFCNKKMIFEFKD
jgi:AraC-like DNA-binding protein